MRILVKDTVTRVGDKITVKGWVNSRRDHGGLIFIDLRDYTGLLQLVIAPEYSQSFKLAEQCRDEFAISVTGVIKNRDNNLVNKNIETGLIELAVEELEILNRSEPLPIAVGDSNQKSNEELRLKYRFLDLRRPKMNNMLRKRAEFYSKIRAFMEDRQFVEVATPILANSSPEGARDFLIPSRVHQGKFYALPQAPQQFKQLLMVGGVDKYYQIATCFRDEDPRADRLYGDFYQLDLERAFVENGEEIREEMEVLIKNLVQDFAGKTLQNENIPRIPYQVAMDKYGSDKPDLRFGMELVDLTSVFKDTDFAVFKKAESVKAIRVKNGTSLTRSQIDKFTDIAKNEGAGGLAYIFIENGEAKSPIAKFLSDKEISEMIETMQAENGDAIFFGADNKQLVNKVLGRLRNEFADFFQLKDNNKVALAWIIDFPFYEYDEKNKKVDFGHNPFSMPKGGVEALRNAKTDAEKLEIVADQYDMVMNGYEICSGAVRNHNPEVMYEVFNVLGYDNEYVENKFGAMLNAFKFGAPPHAGCAFGLDRIFMILMDEDNIREVVAFPKNGSGVDVMMSSPSFVEDDQLKELKIKTIEDEE
ncbi:aspartate--tRNA ligase [Candidatus Nanogingivalis gingivitcus]|jgi:aspartate--tRNA ligase|uniref:Aspartate--tRNA(Asp/Asn) ligase n=1 Tax=Candidatus Nanogingivalis gingivitcus TaxID=2171992 RepID=A0ABY0FKV9_9BACT|nr:aspartate--tRNA ligase [Candidatus Nanogingivalis gingivitcus]RYC72989.1 Aspartate--tRNA ligase [Candidatus Nanogingivalis gingivitcus]